MADFDVKDMIKRVESALAERGMSKEEFYAKSKVSSASFSQWNTGIHKPTLKKIFAMAQCLGVSVEFLTGEEKKEKPATQTGNRQSEIDLIFSQLTPSRQAKLLELARLYLDDQRKNEETQ